MAKKKQQQPPKPTTKPSEKPVSSAKNENIDTIFHKKPFLVAVLTNVGLFLLTYAIYTPFFQTNDDPAMMLEVAGVALSPQPTEYLLFTSVVLGTILKNLYLIMPTIPWYGYYLAFSLLMGNIAILYVLLRRNPHYFSVLLFALYFLLISTFTLISMQFTVTGFVCGLGGLALVFLMPHKSDNLFNIKGLLTISGIIGAFLIGLSLMIRTEAVAMAVVLFSPIILAEFYRQKKLMIPKFIQFGFVLAVCVPLYLMNHVAYSSPEWKEANAFRAGVAQFVDNHVMAKASEEKRKEAMEKVGWRPIDNAMLSFWFFMDKEIYSAKNFETVLSILENEMNTDEIDTYIWDYIYKQPIVNRAMMIALFFVVFLFIKTDDKILLGIHIGFVLLAYLGIHYLLWTLHYLYKQAPPHVYTSAYVFLATLPLFLMHEKTSFNPFKSGFEVRSVVAAVLGLLVFYYGSQGHKELSLLSKNAKANAKNLTQVVKAMNPTPDNLFVVWASSFPYESISPFSDLDFMRPLNLFSLGSIQRTPIADAVLDKFDLKNIYTAIPEKKNIYLIIRQDYQQQYNWTGIYNQYMYEHYQKQIDARPALQAGSLLVFDIKYK